MESCDLTTKITRDRTTRRTRINHFSEKSTVGEWRSEHSISIESEDWETAIKEKQEEMAKSGLGFEVASISDVIRVRMVVPVYIQPERFGKRNENLVGKAVSATGVRIVKGEVEIDYPL